MSVAKLIVNEDGDWDFEAVGVGHVGGLETLIVSRRVPGEVHIANGINAVAFMYQGFKTLDAEKIASKIKDKIT